MLLVVLHDNQAPDAEDVAATKLNRSPFEFHTHGAGVVIDLRNVAQDLGIDFSADRFGKVLGELRVFNLTREGLFHA